VIKIGPVTIIMDRNEREDKETCAVLSIVSFRKKRVVRGLTQESSRKWRA